MYWVLVEIWGPYSSHKIGNTFFNDHCQGRKKCSFVCETVWFFSLANTHLFDLKFVAFCPKFIRDSNVEIQEKTISVEFFGNFVQTKAILYQNSRHFVFGKPNLLTLGLGLTTPYSLGVLVWNFYQTLVTVCIEFWLRFEAQIRPTSLEIIFLLITVRAKRKVRLCVKLFDFFCGRILNLLTWNLSRSVPNSVEILTFNFRKKQFR